MQVVELSQMPQVSTPTPFPIPMLLNPSYNSNPIGHAGAICNGEAISETRSQRFTPMSQGTKFRGLVCTRAKRDLTETEISCVAQGLVQGEGESIDFFLTSYQLICQGWISLPTGIASLTSTDPDKLVVAAFDTLDNLRYYQGATRLLKRFAYVHLIQAINTYKAAAREDRCHSRTPRVRARARGHGDTTIAINTYLSAKGTNGLSRAQLLEHIRIGTR
jgi:hypothetical protein